MFLSTLAFLRPSVVSSHQAAPSTDTPTAMAIPVDAKRYGSMLRKIKAKYDQLMEKLVLSSAMTSVRVVILHVRSLVFQCPPSVCPVCPPFRPLQDPVVDVRLDRRKETQMKPTNDPVDRTTNRVERRRNGATGGSKDATSNAIPPTKRCVR